MKKVYTIAKVTVVDGEIETLEPTEKDFYDYNGASDRAVQQHEATGLRYAIMQLVGVTGSVIRPVDDKP